MNTFCGKFTLIIQIQQQSHLTTQKMFNRTQAWTITHTYINTCVCTFSHISMFTQTHILHVCHIVHVEIRVCACRRDTHVSVCLSDEASIVREKPEWNHTHNKQLLKTLLCICSVRNKLTLLLSICSVCNKFTTRSWRHVHWNTT